MLLHKYSKKKGKLSTSHRYDLLPLLHSYPGGVQRELVVYDFPDANIVFFRIPSKKARLLGEHRLGSGLAGKITGTEGGLEIVAACIGIHVHNLAAEIEAGYEP